jgi:LysM repeat protein
MFRIQSNRQAFQRRHLFFKLSINFWTLTLALILGVAAVDAADTVHRVQKSETLSAIASQYKVSVAEIVKANRLSNPDRIYLGQKLIIPKKRSFERWNFIVLIQRERRLQFQFGLLLHGEARGQPESDSIQKSGISRFDHVREQFEKCESDSGWTATKDFRQCD